MLKTLVYFSYGSIAYAYFGYPLVLALLKRFGIGVRATSSVAAPKNATLIVTVRNEREVIEKKLQNSLPLKQHLEASGGKLQIIVASDASDDGTDDVVLQFKEAGVELVSLSERGGKEKAQAASLERAVGDVVIFTDAKIRLASDAAEKFLHYFSAPDVGAVSSIDRVEGEKGGESGEGFYVSYEMWLRRLESDFNSLVGLSGSCFAVRKAICAGWRTDVPSDFVAMLKARQAGLRGVHAEDIVGVYSTVKSPGEEFSRKVRTVLRGISALWACREILDFKRYGVFAWQVLSHKVMRWLVPWFFILAMVASVPLLGHAPLIAILFLLGMAGIVMAGVAYRKKEYRDQLLFKIPLFFFVSNLAVLIAGIKFLTGQRAVSWNPSAKR